MANPEHLKILKQGIEIWNKWRIRNPVITPDLRKANIQGANLQKASLWEANLREVNLRRADLREADLLKASLWEADLQGADLQGADLLKADLVEANLQGANLKDASLWLANLRRADLQEADLLRTDLAEANLLGVNLQGANLQKANLRAANLREANLRGANLKETILTYTIFANLNLSSVKNLSQCRHLGPSSIDFETIQKSWPLPLEFLRGCGLPDNYIKALFDLLKESGEYYSCFISYSSEDTKFAKKLLGDLQNKGIRCWFAPEDLKIGDKIRPSIDEAIKTYDKLLLVLSENSISSKWVEKEVETAFEKEKSEHTVLFPIRLDNAVMETDQAWAADIRRTRHIGDFREWKNHDKYKKSLDHLIKDLGQT